MEERQSGRLSSGRIRVDRVGDLKKVLEVLNRVFGGESVECASALHQPDGVGSQGSDIGSLSELNGVSIALVAWTRVFSQGACPRRLVWLWWWVLLWWWVDGFKDITTFHEVGWYGYEQKHEEKR